MDAPGMEVGLRVGVRHYQHCSLVMWLRLRFYNVPRMAVQLTALL